MITGLQILQFNINGSLVDRYFFETFTNVQVIMNGKKSLLYTMTSGDLAGLDSFRLPRLLETVILVLSALRVNNLNVPIGCRGLGREYMPEGAQVYAMLNSKVEALSPLGKPELAYRTIFSLLISADYFPISPRRLWCF